ncbi:ATP-grasp domain-containing protein [Lederbergia citrea]|uniref:ATP-grasp domain-containing protein n=1 Tax=Lederbergia citrea TaxID=2833581 RepID=A0A942UTP3_9BACI|nr:ATP-grasp domain-containing protein [Lederbergia citrea]MBS4205993.1 ATP-grasp domain-containing protein [Lederbergia citrea]MBS4224558.1 ATP-grasp domain-containing protein [Lederbergia citrea]
MGSLKTIIFIGTYKSGSSREAIKAAEKLGYFTVVFTNNEKQLKQRKEYTDVHEMIFIDTYNFSEIKKEIIQLRLKGLEIKTIISLIDSNVHLATILCDEFCANNTSDKAVHIMENKEETRDYLKDQSYTPKFFIIKSGDEYSLKSIHKMLGYPVIVKVSNSTGSKDVLIADDKDELEKQISNLRGKYPDEALIIEEYVAGKQYLVEALVYNGKKMIAGIIEQEITKGQRFIITGYGVIAKVPKDIRVGIEKVLQSIITKLGIKSGVLHLELRRTADGWKLIEINPRISGGAMNKMLEAAFGFSLVEETLKLYLGESPSVVPKYSNYVFTQYVIVSKKGILEKVTGKGRAGRSTGVVHVYVKPKKGTILNPPLSMGHRYAYVIARGESMEEAKKLAKNAAKEIEFHLSEEESE